MMQTKQTIAILGATGNTGKIVAKKLASKKYRLLLSDTVEPQINHLIQEISNLHPNSDLEAITCSFEACWESDIIITDLPENSEKEIAEKIRAVANQKTLIQLLSPNHSRRLCIMQDL